MKIKEKNLIIEKILKCLTENFKRNQALFDINDGHQIFSGTDLEMVMIAVERGVEMARREINMSKRETTKRKKQ